MKKLWLLILSLPFLLCGCTESIPTPEETFRLPGLDTATQPVTAAPKPTVRPTPTATDTPQDPGAPTPTPHDNYRRTWIEATGIPEDIPQLAYGVSEVSFLDAESVLLRWSIINEADIDSVCQIVEEWTGRPMLYCEGVDKSGNPTRIWKNDNDSYYLQFTVLQRSEPYFEDGSLLSGEFMISPLGG